MEYKYTLNLPITHFSMKANLNKTELKILERWNSISIYEKVKKKIFILNDGPPYANGAIHIGHAFNKILKDFVCKFKLLSGYKINFIPGWDCHGLPIELNVEKKTNNKDINFRTLCKEYAESQIIIQKKSFIRLGIFADWENPYKTMDASFEMSAINNFNSMLKKNYIYLGYKPNYWCFKCESALAEAEVEYTDEISDSIYFYLECVNFSNNYNLEKIGFLVWTTTPWTLPFNEALAINEKMKYVLINFENKGYILNENLIKIITKKLKFNTYEILNNIDNNILKLIKLKHPIYNREIPIIFSDHVKNDSGTGCVHIAPAYGYDDYKCALKYNLLIVNNVTEKGFFNDDVEIFKSLYYLDSIKEIINHLKNKNILICWEKLNHRYPHCWRHKTKLIFRTTRQWFLNITNKMLKNKIYYLIENLITWIPNYGSIKMKSMFKNRIDWCISRQRFWGIPIMLFVDKNNNMHPNSLDMLNKSINLIKKYGTNFWYNMDVFKIFNIDKLKYSKITDVLDVWFDSSCVYRYLYDNYQYKLPFDLCIEGSDQYRGWFQVSLINSTAVFERNSYKKIITHGFILDNEGKKMSKSLNNVIEPSDIINKYGADVLRLWVSSVNYTIDINISTEIIERVCDSYRKIRNTLRFLLSNLYDFEKTDINKIANILEFDIWALYKMYNLKLEVFNDFFNYNFHIGYKKLYNFCTDDLGGKYMDIIKDRLYTVNLNSNSRKSAQCVFFYILYNLIKLLTPILSFTSEEVWQNLIIKDKKSIFESQYNVDFKAFENIKKFNIFNFILWRKLFKLKDEINKTFEKIRHDKKIGTLLETSVKIICNIYWYNLISNIKNEINLFLQTSSVKLKLIKTNKSNSNSIYYLITKACHNKCERCWHRLLKNFNIKICQRCIFNIYLKHENRFYI